ncbi:MAG: hypothetical protein ACI9BW_002626 [Gammaproteobacteria bacterium]|jgi:hypothetical protein
MFAKAANSGMAGSRSIRSQRGQIYLRNSNKLAPLASGFVDLKEVLNDQIAHDDRALARKCTFRTYRKHYDNDEYARKARQKCNEADHIWLSQSARTH